MSFVFLHVGEDISAPALLVSSIRRQTPDAQIIQCSDGATQEVPGVSAVHRETGDTGNLMSFRLAAFAALGLDRPAAYVDTDMLFVRPVDPVRVLGDTDVAVCDRSFGRDDVINTAFRGMDLTEYANRTFGEIYPYIACFTVTRGPAFWQACHEELLRLPEKFRFWYGDQEAIRNVADGGAFRVKKLPESICGCLPDRLAEISGAPRVLHFKGPQRKQPMIDHARSMGLKPGGG